MEDILGNILSDIDCGSDFKSARLVSHAWLRITQKLYPDGHLRFANHLQTIVELALELNKRFSTSDPIEHFFGKRIQLDFYALSKNPNITWDFIKKHKDLPWDIKSFVCGPNMIDELVDPCLKLFSDHKDVYYISKKLSWISKAKIGFDEYRLISSCPPPPITTEVLKMASGPPYEVFPDSMLARYGSEEVILEHDLCLLEDTSWNPNISFKFALKYCQKFAVYNVIQRNVIELCKEGLIEVRRISDNFCVYIYIVDIDEEWDFSLDLLTCKDHEFIRGRIADPTELRCGKCAMIDNKTIVWGYHIQ